MQDVTRNTGSELEGSFPGSVRPHASADISFDVLVPPAQQAFPESDASVGNASKAPTLHVIDFFCGCGGTSKGMERAGMKVLCGLDWNEQALATFRHNFPEAHALQADIRNLRPEDLEPIIKNIPAGQLLFSGCAPCQPFSKQNGHRSTKDERIPLLLEFLRFVRHFKPAYVFVENVPGLQKVDMRQGMFRSFLDGLQSLHYAVQHDIVASQDYGVPQRRHRLVLIASVLDELTFPKPTHGRGEDLDPYSTVREAISDLPPIRAGESHPRFPNHQACLLSALNLRRINATPVGGSRLDWPAELRLECHSGKHDGHTDVYGRMLWDEPATGLTTRCISLSNGRFGHPEQQRAISVREAARLQTFPDDFVFKGSLTAVGIQIGNAVPVRLAEVFGRHILTQFTRYR